MLHFPPEAALLYKVTVYVWKLGSCPAISTLKVSLGSISRGSSLECHNH